MKRKKPICSFYREQVKGAPFATLGDSVYLTDGMWATPWGVLDEDSEEYAEYRKQRSNGIEFPVKKKNERTL